MHRRSWEKYLLFVAIVICSFSEGLRQVLFGLPIVHLGNVIFICLFVYELMKKGASRLLSKDILTFLIWCLVFLLAGTIGAVIFRPGLLTYLWGVRTYLRMFLVFFDCVMILDGADLSLLWKGFNVAVLIHVILTAVQFLFWGVRWDYLDGIFGTRMADSSSVHALLIIASCLMLYMLYVGKIGWKMFFFYFSWMALNAAVSEIRGWFYEFPALLIIYLVMTRDFKRILKLLPVMAAVYITALMIMGNLYTYASDIVSISGFQEVMDEGHQLGNESAINRKEQITGMTLPMLTVASQKLGDAGKISFITGLGLGSADYSTIPGFQSAFFDKYDHLGYASFLLSFLFVETGLLGLIVFNCMWPILMLKGYLMNGRGVKEGLLMTLYGAALASTSFYNQTLRTNYGYIMWVFLGCVAVACRCALKETETYEWS